MTLITKRECDGPDCKNKVDLQEALAPTYHHLTVGGSDFEMSFGGEIEVDFCCFGCLQRWLNVNSPKKGTEENPIVLNDINRGGIKIPKPGDTLKKMCKY